MIRKIMTVALLVFFWSMTAAALDSIEDAEMSFAKGEFKQAAKLAEKLLKTEPDNIRAGIVLAECYNESKKYMKAISLYKDLVKKAPDNMELVFRLGIVYNNAEYHANAVDVYKQIVAVQPENMKAHHRLGISYALCMDLSAAYDEFRILKKRDEKLANDLLQYIQTNDR